MDRCQLIERSIIKKYRKSIWNNFIGGLKEYRMISAGDRIAVCISGGKDSMLLAKCLQELQRHGSEVPFELEYIVMDPGYQPENRRRIEENARLLELPIRIFESPIFSVVDKQGGSPCYLCARMRRGYLYKYAQELGCNKIALGHHFDDVIETILMSMLYGAEMRTMMPKLHSTNFPGMELIRPLYMVREKDISAWSRYNDLEFIRCACSVTDGTEENSKRAEIKALLAQLRKVNSQIDQNIFRSAENVNLETILGYHKGEEITTFLDTYDQ
ncbi:MAG: tRNA 2-thiocytidine biosynthesis protein TtcA [Clostridia bacterium]|nr:tRNA 2-thiocytidine biosynthesis protein TtcA [Clostridia bacterium]